jgi:hypothetical protein
MSVSPRHYHQGSRSVIVVLLLLLITSCSVASHWWRNTTALKSINLSSTEDANNSSAVMVDIVFVREKNLVAKLPENALDWFAKKKALMLMHADELSVASLQVPPAYSQKSISLPKDYRDAQRVLIYANYVNIEGQVPLEITDYPFVTLDLQKDRVVLVQPD